MEQIFKYNSIQLIAIERNEQVEKHGRTFERDAKENANGQLVLAAIALMEPKLSIGNFPAGWDNQRCLNMMVKPYAKRLVIAAALLAAEIDRVTNT